MNAKALIRSVSFFFDEKSIGSSGIDVGRL